MLHAPSSETKTEATQSNAASEPLFTREQHPPLANQAKAQRPSGMSKQMLLRSPAAQRRQLAAGAQQRYGNQGTLHLLRHAATPGGLLQRKCACGGSGGADGECAECKAREAALQRAPAHTSGPTLPQTAPPIVHEVLRSPGQPLDAGARTFMEPRFGHDFSQVRVHTDARAAESASAVNALAYTVGRDVVFGTGQYIPATMAGRHLLAHELAHTIQQGAGYQRLPDTLQTTHPQDSTEMEAEQASDAIAQGRSFTLVPGEPVEVARQARGVSSQQRSTSPTGGSSPVPQIVEAKIDFYPLPIPVLDPGLSCIAIGQGGFLFMGPYTLLFPPGVEQDIWLTGFIQNVLSDELEVIYHNVPPQKYSISGPSLDVQGDAPLPPFIASSDTTFQAFNPFSTWPFGRRDVQGSFQSNVKVGYVDALGMNIQSAFNGNPNQRVQSYNRIVTLRAFLASKSTGASQQLVVHAVSDVFKVKTTITFGLVSQLGVPMLQANPPQTDIQPNPPQFLRASLPRPVISGNTANQASLAALLRLTGVPCMSL